MSTVPDVPPKSALAGLSVVDRFLPVWIVAAMVLGLGLGRWIPDLNDWLDTVKIGINAYLPSERNRNDLFVEGFAINHQIKAALHLGRFDKQCYLAFGRHVSIGGDPQHYFNAFRMLLAE